MRLWSINPQYLDSKGLVALWREALLAQKVLKGGTKGYKNHPQLIRFRKTINPVGCVASYLRYISEEADKRGYKFDKNKIDRNIFDTKIYVTSGQIKYEFKHLLNKLIKRDPLLYNHLNKIKKIELHPIFEQIEGDVEDWEVV